MVNNVQNSLMPTVFHITHQKCGSQWIKNILIHCFPDKIVQPALNENHFLNKPVLEGKIYPALYVNKQEFYSVKLPNNYKKFIIIRDLRDTLISLYFSMKISHAILYPSMQVLRDNLKSLNLNDGLKFMINSNQLEKTIAIQTSWVNSGEKIIKYEDLLINDTQILKNILIDDFQLPISNEKLNEIIIKNKFSNLTGREPGTEDILQHNRKGIKGDWKNYFTSELKELFKQKYGDHLIKTGYENNLNW